MGTFLGLVFPHAHPAPFVASERLHTGVVHDFDRSIEFLGIGEFDPAIAEIVRLLRWVAVEHVAGIADGDAIVMPIPQLRFNQLGEVVRRELAPDSNLSFSLSRVRHNLTLVPRMSMTKVFMTD